MQWKKSKGGTVKPCPGCGYHVEKTGGCSAMRCSRCQVCFCWLCMKTRGCTCYNNTNLYVHYPPPYGPAHAPGYGWRQLREDALDVFWAVVTTLAVLCILLGIFVVLCGFYNDYILRAAANKAK